MFKLPNIYTSKNLKLFVLIPIALMLIGIYFSTQIVLDTSLRGGVSIILQTNTSTNPATLASEIGSALNSESPSIASSPGGLQITLSINQSLANANNYLVSFYAEKVNYSTYLVNAAALNLAYERNKSNSTLASELSKANTNVNASISKLQTLLNDELTALKPFNIGYASNLSVDPDKLQAAAQGAYTNASSKYKSSIISTLHNFISFTSYSYEQVTPTIGLFFLQELTNTIIITFILIFFVVLIIFRSLVPSFTVVFGAANDIVISLGAMSIFKIPLGIASIGGILMVIGYSIDTDVLTAIRILRRGEGSAESRAYSSMQTGVMMTISAIVSFAVLFIISVIEYVPTYYEITGVVLIGLTADLITTWLGNAPLVLLYKKRKDKS
jgi:preprotein translocase subunit SecF